MIARSSEKLAAPAVPMPGGGVRAPVMQADLVQTIGTESINDWLATYMGDYYPAGTAISVMSREWHCSGHSTFFAEIEVDNPIFPEQLQERGVIGLEDSKRLFYIDDVVAAAVGTGDLAGNRFNVHYRWKR